MKKIVMSFLAVAAFGTTVVGSQTADAEGFIGSGWKAIGQGYSFGGSNLEGFVTSFYVGAPIVQAGTTSSGNNTGVVFVSGATNGFCSAGWCPTTHVAATLCRDNSYLLGNYVWGYVVGGANNTSSTKNKGTVGSGYWLANGQPGTDTGFCPSNQPQVSGGVFMYQFLPAN